MTKRNFSIQLPFFISAWSLTFHTNYLPDSLPPVDGCVFWLANLDEGGGASLPPGGGGRSPRPPELCGRALSFFLVCYRDNKKRRLSHVSDRVRVLCLIFSLDSNYINTEKKKVTPIFIVIVCPSLKPKSSLGVESGSRACLVNSVSCLTHLQKNKTGS